jgi:molybdenum cofactor biosynthesis protein B
VKKWIDDPKVEAVITTGGTGVTGRDVTPEALEGLFEKRIEGFGEVFRWISFQKIGTSTMQSRAIAGVANATYIFALPGSTGACKDGWDDILRQQLDIRFRPCNAARAAGVFCADRRRPEAAARDRHGARSCALAKRPFGARRLCARG